MCSELRPCNLPASMGAVPCEPRPGNWAGFFVGGRDLNLGGLSTTVGFLHRRRN